jgi:PAS domain S-box-containing protein
MISSSENRMEEWKRYVERLEREGLLRDVIVDSWRRCVNGTAATPADPVSYCRVSDEELQLRLQANAELISVAKPHLDWIAATLSAVQHVVYLVDRDGIVLLCTGNNNKLQEDFGLTPGHDWSEARMGTNGAGTALVANKPVAVIGPEHFREAFYNCTCTAAPIHGPDGLVIGAVDITTSSEDSDPSRLSMAAHAAVAIEQSLASWELLHRIDELQHLLNNPRSETQVRASLAKLLLATSQRSVVSRYAVALLNPILALLLTRLFTGVERGPYFPFFTMAVLLSALYGGFWPALVSLALCVFSTLWFVLPPIGSFAVHHANDVVRLMVFSGLSIILAWLVSLLRTTIMRLREAEMKISREREWLAVTLASIGDGVLATDAQGRIVFMNRVAEELAGWTSVEAKKHFAAEVFNLRNESTHAPIQNPLNVALTGMTSSVSDGTLLVRRDGSEIPIDDSASPIRDSSGAVIGAVLVFRDMSARRRAEEQVRNAEMLRQFSHALLRAQDEERRRIARDLHDSVGQTLTAAKMSLAAVERRTQLGDGAASIAQTNAHIDQALSEIRTTSYVLHPPLLDELGFASAAAWYVEGFSKRCGIQVDLQMPNFERLPAHAEMVLFRVLQESLTNIHRHSGSSTATVALELEADRVVLSVRDYGQGMPRERLERFAQTGAGVGVGLAGMRERVRELSGDLRVSSDEHGTLIMASIPVLLAKTVPLSEFPDTAPR